MPLPTLNTGTTDLTNTLSLIAKLKATEDKHGLNALQAAHYNLQNQKIQAELDNMPQVNALKAIEIKKAEAEEKKTRIANESAQLDELAKDIYLLRDHPNPEEAFDIAAKKWGGTIPFPDKKYFTTVQPDGSRVFDADAVAKYGIGGIKARKMLLDAKEGDIVDMPMVNPTYDSAQPPSADNPKMIKQKIMVKNNAFVIPEGSEPEPLVDVVKKQQEELEETRRARKVAERNATASERKASALERGLALRETNAGKSERKGRIVKGTSGATYVVDSKGNVYVPGFDEDGIPTRVPATEEQIKDVKLGNAKDGKGGLAALKETLGKKGGAGAKPAAVKSSAEERALAAQTIEKYKNDPAKVAAIKETFKSRTGETY